MFVRSVKDIKYELFGSVSRRNLDMSLRNSKSLPMSLRVVGFTRHNVTCCMHFILKGKYNWYLYESEPAVLHGVGRSRPLC